MPPTIASPAQTRAATVIFVRHAEKVDESSDAVLSDAGKARAQALAHALFDVGLTAIYTTDFARTRGTAAPIANALGIVPAFYDAERATDEIAAIATRHPGETVLVVGHSPSIPTMVKALVEDANVTKLGRYDELFIVVSRKVVRLRYGAPSPSEGE